jgi:hypothetical protein
MKNSPVHTPHGIDRILCCLIASFTLLPLQVQSAGADLGTLFYSPAERAAITASRSGGQSTALPQGAAISLKGLVKREGSKSTAWINGQTVREGQAVRGGAVPLISPRHVTVDGQSVRVGETVDIENGARSDMVPKNAVNVRRQR